MNMSEVPAAAKNLKRGGFKSIELGDVQTCRKSGLPLFRWCPVVSRHGFCQFGIRLCGDGAGALAEYIQLRVKYAYCGDSLMDGELYDTMSALDLKPNRKSFIVVRAGNCVKQ